MNTALWIAAAVLAIAFLGAGITKLTKSKAELRDKMPWVDDFSPGVVKIIGALEILAAVGLILPALVDVLPILVPIAATGLVLMMLGAAATHSRRKEFPMLGPNLVLLALAAFVAWGRFGPHSF